MGINRFKSVGVFGAASLFAITACNGDAPTPGAENTNGVSADCTPQHENVNTIQEGTLTVAQYDYPPFSVYDESTGELTGVEGEVLARFAEMQCLEVEVVQGDAAAMITSVETGRADTTLGSWYRTADRAEVVRLSEPVITSPLSIVSEEGIDTVDDLLQADLGMVQGGIGIDEIQDLVGDDLNIYQSVDAKFADLEAGRIDAAVQGYGAAITQVENRSLDSAQVMPIEPDERLTSTLEAGQTNFPTNMDNESLGTAIDEVINALRDEGVIEEIAGKYGFSADVADPGDPNLL